MQDPSSVYSSQINQPQFPEQEILKCPRCDSINTKFCYYNNYNLSQPRHFCKNCKRYWTKGGILRKIPVGGSSRKNTKRSSSNSKRSPTTSFSSSTSAEHPKTEHFAVPVVPAFDQKSPIVDVNGPFSSSLTSNGPEIGNFFEGLNPIGPYSGLGLGPVDASQIGNGSSNGWPDLAI